LNYPFADSGRPITAVKDIGELPGLLSVSDRAVRVTLFGGCSVSARGRSEIRISSRKGRAFIAYLTLAPRMQAGREQLASLLWGDSPDALARQSLRQRLIALRKDLGPLSEALASDSESVALRGDLVSADAVEFQECVASDDAARIDRALALYRGPFLHNFNVEAESFAAWVTGERDRFERMATRAMEIRAAYLDTAGDGRQAIGVAESLVARDPLREDWQRSLLQLYARHNCREVALQHAQKFAAHLKAELGVDPEPATRALIERILRDEFTPAAADGAASVSRPNPEPPCSDAHENATASSGPDGRTRFEGLGGLAGRRPRLFASLVFGIAVLIAVVAAREFAESPRGLHSVDEERATPDNSYPIPIEVLPFTTSAGTVVDKSLSDRLNTDLADRLSLFPGFRVLASQPAQSVTDRARYVVYGEFRATGDAVRAVLRLVNDGRQTLIDQAQLPSDPRGYEELLVRWAAKLQVVMTLAEGRAARRSKGTDEPMQIHKGQAAHLRGTSLENVAEATTSFEEALRLNPNSVPAMVGLAAQLISGGANLVAVKDKRSDQLERADQLLQRAVELEPRSPGVHYWIGQLHNNRNEFELAQGSFERSLELNPGMVSSMAALGNVLARMGRDQEGIDKIAQALRLAPDHPHAGTFILWWARAEIERGNEGIARELLLSASQKTPGNARIFGLWAAADALANDPAATAQHLAKFKSLSGAESLEVVVNRLRAQVGRASRAAKGLDIAMRNAS
jgi:DNA-binding SARP family transcriptional activator/tetratricopeptide (TPR) repeat protein